LRDKGETTRQMQAAPENALYIWCAGNTYYPRHLARHLGREDLKIVPKWWPDHSRYTRRVVVVDHAAVLSHKALGLIAELNSRSIYNNEGERSEKIDG